MIEINITKKLNFNDEIGTLDVSLKINRGEFVVISGKSGSGKSTILKIVAGLNVPDYGTIKLNDKTVWFDSEKKINIAPQKRCATMLFQDYALFPNMTVFENIHYACGNKTFTLELLEMAELLALGRKYPDRLSGGQKQRVALMRAIARKPEILLLDEPLSAVDTAMRTKLQEELLRYHECFAFTTIMVTHDVSEILQLADRVCILEKGRIIRDGSPNKIFPNSHSFHNYFNNTEKLDLKKAHCRWSW